MHPSKRVDQKLSSFQHYLNTYHQVLTQCQASTLEGSVSMEEALQNLIAKLGTIKECAGKVLFIGNGGSAAIANHLVIDYWKMGEIRAMAFNDACALTCYSNDYSYDAVFAKPISLFADAGDLLFAISSSGKSANILNAVDAAKKCGCFCVTLSGFGSDNPLRRLGDINFYLPIDHYGIVETGHQMILHYLIDLFSKTQVGSPGSLTHQHAT